MSTPTAPFVSAAGGAPDDPFDRLTRRLGLRRQNLGDVFRMSCAVALVTWLPMAVLALLEGRLGGRIDPLAILREPSITVRLLISLPLMFYAEALLHWSSASCIEHLVDEGIVGRETPHVQRLAGDMCRRRDSKWPDFIFAAVSLGAGLYVLFARPGHTGLLTGGAVAAGLARSWYCLTGLPLYAFLLLRLGWRWLVWCWFLFRISRLTLELVPTHPDRKAGLEMVSAPSAAMAVVFSAIAALACAQWLVAAPEKELVVNRAVALLVLSLIVCAGPMLLFTRQMASARFRGLVDYGRLSHDYVRAFHQKWVAVKQPPPDLLGHPDFQSLADLGNGFRVIVEMGFLPISVRRLLIISGLTIAPLLPLAFVGMPVSQVIRELVKVAL